MTSGGICRALSAYTNRLVERGRTERGGGDRTGGGRDANGVVNRLMAPVPRGTKGG